MLNPSVVFCCHKLHELAGLILVTWRYLWQKALCETTMAIYQTIFKEPLRTFLYEFR
jgi:hypothetical protein